MDNSELMKGGGAEFVAFGLHWAQISTHQGWLTS